MFPATWSLEPMSQTARPSVQTLSISVWPGALPPAAANPAHSNKTKKTKQHRPLAHHSLNLVLLLCVVLAYRLHLSYFPVTINFYQSLASRRSDCALKFSNFRSVSLFCMLITRSVFYSIYLNQTHCFRSCIFSLTWSVKVCACQSIITTLN